MTISRALYLTSEAIAARFTFTRFALLLLAIAGWVGAWEMPT